MIKNWQNEFVIEKVEQQSPIKGYQLTRSTGNLPGFINTLYSGSGHGDMHRKKKSNPKAKQLIFVLFFFEAMPQLRRKTSSHAFFFHAS